MELDARHTKVKNSGERATAEAATEGLAGQRAKARRHICTLPWRGGDGLWGEGEGILGATEAEPEDRAADGRAMGALDSILYGKLKLLHISRSA